MFYNNFQLVPISFEKNCILFYLTHTHFETIKFGVSFSSKRQFTMFKTFSYISCHLTLKTPDR
jgi:hypothetical protein